MKRRDITAGRYAAQRAESIRKDWEKRASPKARLFFWPVIAIGAVGILIARPDPWGVAFGFLIGAGVMGYAFLLSDVPDEVFRWERGAEGERRTEQRLRALEAEGWIVTHDVQRGRGNWDHVVVGPPGIFVLETKDRRGQLVVTESGPQLYLDGSVINDPKVAQWPRYLGGAAAALKEEIERTEGGRPWVHPVLVFWGDFPAQTVETPRLTFVHGDHLVDWLTSRPAKLSRGKQALYAAAVEEIAERASVPQGSR